MLGWDFWSVLSVGGTPDTCCPTGKSKMAGDIDLGVSLGCFTCSKGVQINLACFYNAIFVSNFLRQRWRTEIWARFLVRQPCAKWILADQNSILHQPKLICAPSGCILRPPWTDLPRSTSPRSYLYHNAFCVDAIRYIGTRERVGNWPKTIGKCAWKVLKPSEMY